MPTQLRMLIPAAGLALAVSVGAGQPALGQVPVDVANAPVPWDARVELPVLSSAKTLIDAAGEGERLVVTDIIAPGGDAGGTPQILRGASSSTNCGSTSLVLDFEDLTTFSRDGAQQQVRFTTPAGIGFEPGEQLCVEGYRGTMTFFGYTQAVPGG